MRIKKSTFLRIFAVVASVVILTTAVAYVSLQIVKTHPKTRDYYCEYTGGRVTYPAMHWKCDFEPFVPGELMILN